MRIQIIGVGVVGGAQAYLMSKLGHEVIGVDRNRSEYEYARMVREPQTDVDATFVCTQEGSVPAVVAEMAGRGINGIYVIKSTVPVGTTRSLMTRYHVHICHNPEFLIEERAFETISNPAMVAIGQCCREHSAVLEQIYSPMGCPIVVAKPDITEAVKITLNSYLATLITFWNQVDKVTKALGLETAEVARIAKMNPRVSAYGTAFFGSPFGGKCLPKDLEHMINIAQKAGVDASLLETVRAFNETV